MPHPLPPPIPYDEDLAYALSNADKSLGNLNGIGRIITNPYLLIRPLLHQEALSSSAIEETYSTITQLYMFEIGGAEEFPQSNTNEVANYVKAMNYGFGSRRRIPFSLRLVRELHKILLKDVRGTARNPENFRKHLVAIGSPDRPINEARLIPPPKIEMEVALDQWEKFCHSKTKIPPLILAALIHYQFEVIHPFYDGNGRVGRMLISIFLHEKGYLDHPMLFISRFFEWHCQEYYKRLQSVNEVSDWKGWIIFFFEAVEKQSEQNLKTAQKIIDLQTKYVAILKRKDVPGRYFNILDHLFVFPLVTINKVKEVTNNTYPTAKTDVEKLVNLGILKEVAVSGRKRIFKMEELINILES